MAEVRLSSGGIVLAADHPVNRDQFTVEHELDEEGERFLSGIGAQETGRGRR
jgi:uncharacterized protein YueI